MSTLKNVETGAIVDSTKKSCRQAYSLRSDDLAFIEMPLKTSSNQKRGSPLIFAFAGGDVGEFRAIVEVKSNYRYNVRRNKSSSNRDSSE